MQEIFLTSSLPPHKKQLKIYLIENYTCGSFEEGKRANRKRGQ